MYVCVFVCMCVLCMYRLCQAVVVDVVKQMYVRCVSTMSHTLCTLYCICIHVHVYSVCVCVWYMCVLVHTSVVLVACFNFSFSISIYLRIHFL